MTAEMFAAPDPILVLNVQFGLKHAGDDCYITEPSPMRVLKNFLVGWLQKGFLVYLGVVFGGSGCGIYSIVSCPDAIYWLLA